MATPNLNAAPARIPRFVRHLNEYAQSHGIEVEVAIEPYSDDPELRLWSKWRTTRERLYTLDVVTPGNRLPLTRGRFCVPSGCNCSPEYALLNGDVTVNGDEICWEIDCGPPVYEVAELGGAEVVSYEREIVHFGTLEALLAIGIEPTRLPTGKYDAKRGDGGFGSRHHAWVSRRAPLGTVLYRIETDQALRDRIAKDEEYGRQVTLLREEEARALPKLIEKPESRQRPTYLRLVVDNTRA